MIDKVKISKVIFDNSDLGGKSAKIAGICITDGIPYLAAENDPITAVIVHAVNEAGDKDELEMNFNYAISQLEIAKHNALNAI